MRDTVGELRVKHAARKAAAFVRQKVEAAQPSIRIYDIDGVEWYAARSPEDALRAKAALEGHKSVDAMRRDYGVDGFEVSEVPAAALEKLTCHEEPEDGSGDFVLNFRAKLDRMIAAGETFPRFFATTEY